MCIYLYVDLRLIITGMQKVIFSIVLVFVFGVIFVYGFAIVSVAMYSPEIITANKNNTICEERFGSIESALFTMFQIGTAESWADANAVRLLTVTHIILVSFGKVCSGTLFMALL